MMFRSIFSKLLATNLLIIILVISVLFLAITIIYQDYVFEQKQQVLKQTGHYVNILLNQLEAKDISQEELNVALDSMGYVSDAKIYAIRIDKKALENPQNLQLGEGLEGNYLLSDFQAILNGDEVFRQQQYSKNFNMMMIFAGIPWTTDSGIAGTILLFSPVSRITGHLKQLNLVIGFTALFFILLSSLVIYFNSRRISRPIKEMEQAAGKLASGENTEDLVVKSNDEIGKLAASFNYMKQQLADTEKIRREFIANVSHDMRTPLTSINGFIRGMLDGTIQPQDYNRYLLIIKEETTRLTRLSNEVLQLAKIQAGSTQLNRKILNVKDVLETVSESMKTMLEEKSLTLSVHCEPSLSLSADKDKLKQILINILDNAIKYTPPEGKISLEAIQKENSVLFRIRDTGIGISPEDLPRIFEKFYRVDKSRQSLNGGSGLGLNIAQSLVELHKGKIRAVSDPKKGTEISFNIPL
jgi:signal transduction histidine kinase